MTKSCLRLHFIFIRNVRFYRESHHRQTPMMGCLVAPLGTAPSPSRSEHIKVLETFGTASCIGAVFTYIRNRKLPEPLLLPISEAEHDLVHLSGIFVPEPFQGLGQVPGKISFREYLLSFREDTPVKPSVGEVLALKIVRVDRQGQNGPFVRS